MRNWNWTPRAKELWFMIKFTTYGFIFVGLLILADWWARNRG